MRVLLAAVAAFFTTEANAAPSAAPPAVFAKCSGCHPVTKGTAAGVGPNLWGVGGSKAGSGLGYVYSMALQKSAVTWTSANLSAFVLAPSKVAPGTRMPALGVTPEESRSLANYLLSLK